MNGTTTFPCINYMSILQLQNCRVNKTALMAVSKNKISESLAQDASDGEAENVEKKPRKTRKRAPTRSRKKEVESSDETSVVDANAIDDDISAASVSTENVKKTQTRTRRKGYISLTLNFIVINKEF